MTHHYDPMGDYDDRYTEGQPVNWWPFIAVILTCAFLAALFVWLK